MARQKSILIQHLRSLCRLLLPAGLSLFFIAYTFYFWWIDTHVRSQPWTSGWRPAEKGVLSHPSRATVASPPRQQTCAAPSVPEDPEAPCTIAQCVYEGRFELPRECRTRGLRARDVRFSQVVSFEDFRTDEVSDTAPSFAFHRCYFEQGLSFHNAHVATLTIDNGAAADLRTQTDRCDKTAVAYRYRNHVHGELDLGGLQADAVSLDGLHATTLSLVGAAIERDLTLRWATVEELDAVDMSASSLNAFRLTVGHGLVAFFGSTITHRAYFQCGTFLGEVDFELFKAAQGVNFAWTRIEGPAKFYYVETKRLDFSGATLGLLAVNGADIKWLDLSGARLRRLEFHGGRFDSLHLTDLAARVWNTEGTDIGVFLSDDGLEGTLYALSGRRSGCTRGTYTALEMSLRSQGRQREANRVHLIGRMNTLDGPLEAIPLVILDGIGNPLFYISALCSLIALSVALWFGRWTPHRGGSEARALYSPWLLAIATLLPGDILVYLRKFDYQPRTRSSTIGLVAFQLVALILQVLLVSSVVSLVKGK